MLDGVGNGDRPGIGCRYNVERSEAKTIYDRL